MFRIISFGFAFLSASVMGQGIETDRPDQTESSAVLPAKTFQIETGMGASFTEDKYTGIQESTLSAPTALFRISISEKCEFRLVNTLEHHKADLLAPNESRGWHIDDLELGTKIQLINSPNRKTQMAIMQHLVLPTSLSNATAWGLITKLLVSHQLGNNFSLGYNIGYDFRQFEGQLLTYSIALGIPVNAIIGAYIETYGDYWIGSAMRVNFDGGFTFAIKDNIQLDYSFGIGITQRMNYQAIGFSIRLPN